MGTASEATPKLSGHLMKLTVQLLILMPCSLTFPGKGATHTLKKQIMQLRLDLVLDLGSVKENCLHKMSHLMVYLHASQIGINLDMKFHDKTTSTCYLT